MDMILKKEQQSEARIDRIGQTKPMTYIDIICEDTVDERIVKALRKNKYCKSSYGRRVKSLDLETLSNKTNITKAAVPISILSILTICNFNSLICSNVCLCIILQSFS